VAKPQADVAKPQADVAKTHHAEVIKPQADVAKTHHADVAKPQADVAKPQHAEVIKPQADVAKPHAEVAKTHHAEVVKPQAEAVKPQHTDSKHFYSPDSHVHSIGTHSARNLEMPMPMIPVEEPKIEKNESKPLFKTSQEKQKIRARQDSKQDIRLLNDKKEKGIDQRRSDYIANDEELRRQINFCTEELKSQPIVIFVEALIKNSKVIFSGKTNSNSLPLPIKKCVEYLETEGCNTEYIFEYRYFESIEKLNKMKSVLDAGGDLKALKGEPPTPLLVADILKSYLKDFKATIINMDGYDPSVSFNEIKDEQSRLQFLKELVNTLTPTNKALIEIVINLLVKIDANSAQNKMNSTKLSSILGSFLLRNQILDYKKPHVVINKKKLIL